MTATPATCPCGHDPELRHVNTRTAGDDRPDRAVCRHCHRQLERAPGIRQWTAAQLASVSGRSTQCPAAPNPDDGPMPGHTPDGFLVHPPAN